MQEKLLSIILPVYKGRDCIAPLYGRLTATLRVLDLDYEIIFVDDLSPDNSWDLLCNLVRSDEHVSAFKHKSNYGQFAAIATGLSKSRGDLAIVLDADLQDPPELIPQFLKKAQEGNDIVLSVRKRRSGSLFRRFSSTLLRKFISLYQRFPNGLYYGSFLLMSRRIVDRYLQEKERFHFSIKVLDKLDGKFSLLEYDQSPRGAGPSSYSLRRAFQLFCKAVGCKRWSVIAESSLFLGLLMCYGVCIELMLGQFVVGLILGITAILSCVISVLCRLAVLKTISVCKEVDVVIENSMIHTKEFSLV